MNSLQSSHLKWREIGLPRRNACGYRFGLESAVSGIQSCHDLGSELRRLARFHAPPAAHAGPLHMPECAQAGMEVEPTKGADAAGHKAPGHDAMAMHSGLMRGKASRGGELPRRIALIAHKNLRTTDRITAVILGNIAGLHQMELVHKALPPRAIAANDRTNLMWLVAD